MRVKLFLIAVLISIPYTSSASRLISTQEDGYRVVEILEINPSVVQGFLIHDDQFVVCSGGYGTSQILIMEKDQDKTFLQTIRSISLPKQYYGEGCTVLKDEEDNAIIIVLTWRERAILIYDFETLSLLSVKQMPNQMVEGYGLTHFTSDPSVLYATDSTDKIIKLRASDYSFISSSRVMGSRKDWPRSHSHLNELESYGDKLLANKFLTDLLYIIDKKTSRIDSIISLAKLTQDSEIEFKEREGHNFRLDDCLNGIAYNQTSSIIYITGKMWGMVYGIEIIGATKEEKDL